MTLNLLTRREYYCDSNNKYYCRTRTFSPEAPYLVKWDVWCDERNTYIAAEYKQEHILEQEYLVRFA